MKFILLLFFSILITQNLLNACEINQWQDATGACQPCFHACASCSDQAENHCLTCSSDKTHIDGFCKCTNENQYIDKEGICQNCFQSCKTCIGPLFYQCTSCDATHGQILQKQEWEMNGTCWCSDDAKYAINGAACGTCHSSCGKCLSSEPNQCIKCPNETFKQPWGFDIPGFCIAPCATKQYRDMAATTAALQICRTCSSLCSNCSGPSATECTGCIEGYFLSGKLGHPGECFQKCEDQTKYRDINGTCSPCDVACGSCFGPSKGECYQCAANYYEVRQEDNFICVQQCEIGKFRNLNTGACEPCWETCTECKGPNNGECLKCNIGFHKTPYYEQVGQCLQEENCGTKQYRDQSDYCAPCHDTCLHCKGPNPYECSECDYQLSKVPPGKDLTGNCLVLCEDTLKYRDPSDGLCKQCHESCEACIGEGEMKCLKCVDKTKVIYPKIEGYPGQCVTPCAEKKFWNGTSCVDCHSTCQQCKGPEITACLECPVGSVKEPLQYGIAGLCLIENCAQGQYKIQEPDVCGTCDPSCQTCRKEGEFGCLTCDATKVKIPAFNDALGKCLINTCASNEFIDILNNYECKPCYSTYCATCLGPTQKDCLTCSMTDGYYKFPAESGDQKPGYCVQLAAASDYYCGPHKLRNMETGACEECPGSCAECVGMSEAKCSKCYEGMIKVPALEGKEGACVAPCQEGFYRLNNYEQCQPCHSDCKVCEGGLASDCLACPSDKIKQPPTKNVRGHCVAQCESHKYFDISQSTCLDCNETCLDCSGPTSQDCLSCDVTRIKIPWGYENPGQCIVGTCDANKFATFDGTTLNCVDCNVSCLTCFGPQDNQCLSCDSGKAKMPPDVKSPGKCYTPCANTHQFMDAFGDMTCKECFSNCATCLGPLHIDCLTCNSGFVKQFNKDDDTLPANCEGANWCPEHQYNDGTNCQECDPSCKQCLGPGRDKCTICQDGKIKAPWNHFVGGYCVNQCPMTTDNVPQYSDPLDNFICKVCHNTCDACIGPNADDCLKCKDQTKVKYPRLEGVKGICLDQCAEGENYYLTDASTTPITCAVCHSTCVSCVDNQETSCITCQATYYKDPPEMQRTGKCLPACTEATPSYRDATNTCVPCHDTCGSCLKGSEWDCLTCTGTKIKIPSKSDQPGKCFNPCTETHKYLNESDYTCQECHSSCATCIGGHEFQCLTCNAVLYKNPADKNNFDLSLPGLCQTFFYCPQENQYRGVTDAQCQPCDSTCGSCFGAGPSQCKYCSDSTKKKYPPNPEVPGQCLAPCPLAYQYPDTTGACQNCHESCDLCFGGTETDCLSCRNFTLVKYPLTQGIPGKCLQPCQDGQYRDPSDWTLCVACHYTCKTCTGTTEKDCLMCKDNFTKANYNFEMPGICDVPCADPSYYKDKDTQTCKPCHTTCYTCAGPEPKQCLKCKPEFVPSEPYETSMKSCLIKCQTTVAQFRNPETLVCQDCFSSCTSCFGPEDWQCLSCREGVIRESQEFNMPTRCLQKCILGYYLAISGTTWSCNKCVVDCIECSGPSSTECTKCPEDKDKIPKYEGPGVCVGKCEFPNQYHDTAANNYQCKLCHSDCSECSGPEPTQCYKCAANTLGKVKWPPTDGIIGSCIVNDCDVGKYKAPDNTCWPCFSNCKSCLNNETNSCIECNSGFVKFPPKFGTPTECITNPCTAANPGYINPQDSTQCLACNESCASCLFGGPDGCLTCPTGYVKVPSGADIPGFCVISCEQGYFRNFTNSSYQICSPCFGSCLTCEGPNDWECLSCKTGLFLNKINNYQNIGKCDTFGICPEGQYGDPTTNLCANCNQSSCKQCVGPQITDCKYCADGFEKLPPSQDMTGQCVVPCLDAYTFRDSAGACSPCHLSCKTCSGLLDTECLICKDVTLVKYPKLEGTPGKCLQPCNEHYFRYSIDSFADCHVCDNSCGNCKGPSPNECLSCNSGFVKIPFNPDMIGSCFANCAVANQYMGNDSICYPCNTKCATCIGPYSYDCLTCPTNTVRLNPDIRYNTSCVTACENGKFWNIANSSCDPCHYTCKTCMGPQGDQCLTCKDHVINPPPQGSYGICGKLDQGLWCESHFFMNDTALMTCAQCHANCSECKGPDNNQCTKCYEYFELFLTAATDAKGECIKMCDAGFYRSATGGCVPCDESCFECKGPDLYQCKSCATGLIKLPPSFELLGRCVTACTDTATYRDLDGSCKPCSTMCLTCSGGADNECLSCTSPKVLDQIKYGVPGNCITTTCQTNQYYDGTQCLNCSSECITCVGPNIWECISCATDKIKYPAQIGIPAYCLTKCNDTFYRDISNWEFQECKPCHSSCLTCEGPEAEKCITCQSGLYFNGKLEFKGTLPGPCQTWGNCPEKFFRVLTPDEKCEPCHSTCQKCKGLTANDCLECPTYLIKYPPAYDTAGQCLEYCQPGQYRDTTSGNCTACHPSCEECTNASDQDCLKCKQVIATEFMIKYPQTEGIPGKCIVNGTCTSNQYADPDDTWTCKDCNPECQTCSGGTNTKCLTCPTGFFKNPMDFGVPGQCIQACTQVNQYKNADGVCVNCDSSCVSCLGQGPSQCLNCLTTQYKIPPETNLPGYCLNKCTLVHQYRSKNDFECYECHSACQTCIGNTEYDCLSCFSNVDYFKFNNGTIQCYTWCYNHQYKASTGECKQCNDLCAECAGDGANNCWSCWAGYVKIPSEATVVGTCYEKCQEGSYRAVDGYCKQCHTQCKACEGGTENDCLICAIATQVKVPAIPNIKGKCMESTCTTSQYLDATGGCLPCNDTCVKCVGGTNLDCMTCATDKVKFPFYIDQPGMCVSVCESGFYRKNETICGQCHSTCATCMNGTEKHCLTCTSPLVHQTDSSGIGPCVQPCAAGFYRDITSTYYECKQCYYSCATCTGPDSWLCKTCQAGYYFNAINGEFGSCDLKGICDPHKFRDSSDNCQECDSTCLECSIIASNCTACSYEFKLIDGKCLLPCDQALQPQTYRDATTNLCKPCHTSCKVCVGPLVTDCLFCMLATQTKYPNIEGMKGQCYDSCNSNQYFELANNSCTNCSGSCATCSGPLNTECLTCPAGFIKKSVDPKIPSECIVQNCTSSQYLMPDGTCKPCSTKCLTCAGYSEYDCLSCVSTMKLLKFDGDYKGQCIVPCNSGYFRKPDGNCEQCYKNCLTCSGPEAWNCLTCISGLHKNPYEAIEGQCDEYGKCPQMNQFRNSSDLCQNCDQSCKECFGSSSSQCRICSDMNKIKIPSSYELPGYCAYPCTEKSRFRKTDGTCAACHTSCLVCSGPYDYQCEVCADTTLIKYPQLIGQPGKCMAPCPETNQYYDTTSVCKNCSALCSKCSGGGEYQCLSCIDGYYKLPTGEIPGGCYQKCASQQYRDPYNNTCMGCHASCTECVGPTDYDCISCNTGYYKEYPEESFVGKCFQKCTTTTQFRGYDEQCYDCPYNCATCTGPSEEMCQSCLTGFYLNPPGKLIGRCESKAICYTDHQYRDADNSCKECDASCITCFAAGTDKCRTCPAGKMKIPFSIEEPGSCLDSCPEGQYNNAGTCTNCSADCQKCTGGSSNDCLICFNHSLIKMPPAIDQPGFCAAPCDPGKYASSATTCAECHTDCLSCVAATLNDCLVCAGGKIKYPATLDKPGQCLTPCTNTSEFPTVGGDCKPCFEGCLTCSGPEQIDCLTCPATLVKNTPVGQPGACVKGCSSTHQYPDSDGVCQECDATCLTCKGPGMYSCLTCASGQQKHPPSIDKLGLCSSCAQHQFLDKTGTGYCEECSYGCAACFGLNFNNCLSCDATVFRTLVAVNTSVYPYEQECQCINYYVQEVDTTDSTKTVCNACHYSCMQCSTSATETACTKCEEPLGRIFDNTTNKCICNEIGFYTIADQLACGKCFPTCKRCTNNSRYACLECYGSIDVWTDGSCGCITGEYLNSEFLCVKPEECGNGLVGIVSEANPNNTGNICGPKPCPIPYFFNYTTIECKDKCFSTCLTCISANETSCLTCTPSTYMTSFGTTGTCTVNCNEFYFYVPAQINPAKINACLQQCPIGFGPIENVTQKCGACNPICKTCYKANDEYACYSCNDTLSLSDSYGTQLFNNKTVNKITCQICKSGYYQSTYPQINDSTITAATATCIPSCLKGQYSDKLNRKCINCKDVNCLTCKEKYDYCELCLTGYDLIEGICQPVSNQESCIKKGYYIKGADLQCVQECGIGYYQNGATHICEKCHQTCATCSKGEDPNKCLTCSNNLIYYKAKQSCVYNCPGGSYLSESSTTQKACYECILGCGMCSGPAIADCTQCATTHFQISDATGKLKDCVKDCSTYDSNTYGEKTSQSCQKCNSKCKQCINGLESGCLSCYNDDIFSKKAATDPSGYCKVKAEQATQYASTSAADISTSSADELQQKATEIVAAFTSTVTTTTTTSSTGTTTTNTASETVTTQTKEEIAQNQQKKEELITAVITTAKEMSQKESLTPTEASSLVSAMKASVQPEVSVTLVTSTGEKIKSSAVASSNTSSAVVRKFEKEQALTICDTLSNIADKIDVKANQDVTRDMFSAASDLLKQTSTLQQDKKVAKGEISSMEDNADSTLKTQIKEDMEVVKKVVSFCNDLSNKIKEKLQPGESMSFNTTEMKLTVNKFSAGNKDSLKSAIMSSLTSLTTASTTASTTSTTQTGTAATTTDATAADTTKAASTVYYDENGKPTDDTNPNRTVNAPEIAINEGLIDHLNNVLDKLKSEGKNVDSLTVKQASYDLDINTLSKNTSDENSTDTIQDFTRASMLQQFGFELEDGSKVNIADLGDSAQFEIKFDYIPEADTDYSCVYWNEEKKIYDNTGVELDPITKLCKAKHLTDFIVQKVKNNKKLSFNYGILATIIPISICILLFALWFFKHNKNQINTFETIGDNQISFCTVSPLISIWKSETIPDVINRIMHFACYLITVMMLLVLYFRDSIEPEKNFDKLLVTGIIFSLSISIIVKYFLGAIKVLSQFNPIIYCLLSIAYFAACSGITIWRMNDLTHTEQWNWFHAMYLTFIFDLLIMDILLIISLKKGLGKNKQILHLVRNGGFLILPNSNINQLTFFQLGMNIIEGQQMRAKANLVLDSENQSKQNSSQPDSDHKFYSNDLVVIDNVEGEQFGSRPESKAGILKN